MQTYTYDSTIIHWEDLFKLRECSHIEKVSNLNVETINGANLSVCAEGNNALVTQTIQGLSLNSPRGIIARNQRANLSVCARECKFTLIATNVKTINVSKPLGMRGRMQDTGDPKSREELLQKI